MVIVEARIVLMESNAITARNLGIKRQIAIPKRKENVGSLLLVKTRNILKVICL